MLEKSDRRLPPWAFLGICAIVAVSTFFFPFGTWRDFKILGLASFGQAAVVLTGDSVIKHYSICDADRRYVSEIVSGNAALPLQDLSYGGQSIIEQLAYLGAASNNQSARTLVLTVALTDFLRVVRPSLRRRELFAIVSPANEIADGPAATRLSDLVLGGDLPFDFDYDGEHFPSYDYIKRRYLGVEQSHASCPEADAWDRRFLKAYYYGTYVHGDLDDRHVGEMARLDAHARARGKRLMVVVKPMDIALIEQMDAAWARSVRARMALMVDRMRQAGLEVTDLSESLPSEDFADRWCACGHLQERGRQKFGEAIARALRKSSGA